MWDKTKILAELRRRQKAGEILSYNAVARASQSLVSAAAYHFGSYRQAVETAGIDYAEVMRRPRWSRQAIIAVLKQAKRNGEDLHWSAVTRRRDELGKAAFAALQPRLFGRWDRALQAAGLDADEVSRYRRWDRNAILSELKSYQREDEPLNSGAVQRADPSLHAAAVRHFGDYETALRAGKIDPDSVRRRRVWDKPTVLKAIRGLKRQGTSPSDTSVRKTFPALYGAASRLFGSFTRARAEAGVKFQRGGK